MTKLKRKKKRKNVIEKIADSIVEIFTPEPFSDEYHSKVLITENAYLKIYYWIKLHPEEVGGLLKVDYDGNRWIIEDAILLNQRTQPAYFEIDDDALARFSLSIDPKEMHKWKGWWHSHVNMNVFWSGVDVDTFEKMNDVMGDVVGIVLNKKREINTGIIKNKKTYKADIDIVPNDMNESKYFNDLVLNVIPSTKETKDKK